MSFPFDCITNFMFFETQIEPADVILIPGSSQPQLMARAAELYHQGLAPFVLPSGGATPNVETTEWAFLRDEGVRLGIPKDAILQEDQAANTFQNSSLSLEVLTQADIYPKKIILVCKNYHARRALLTYQIDFPRETAFLVSPVIDKTGISKENWFLEVSKINKVMSELEKVARYFGHHIPNWVK
ncbi:YdcF family protein [Paenibacillus sp. BAC0078]